MGKSSWNYEGINKDIKDIVQRNETDYSKYIKQKECESDLEAKKKLQRLQEW